MLHVLCIHCVYVCSCVCTTSCYMCCVFSFLKAGHTLTELSLRNKLFVFLPQAFLPVYTPALHGGLTLTLITLISVS